jgi:hypothetical protein
MSIIQDNSVVGFRVLKPIISCLFLFSNCVIGQIIPYGKEMIANTDTLDSHISPSVTGLSGNGIAVGWQSWIVDEGVYRVYGQILDYQGHPVGKEFFFAKVAAHDVGYPLFMLAPLVDNKFFACWQGWVPNSGNTDIFGRIYNAQGSAESSEITVNTSTQHFQIQPAVAVLMNGGFVVCWASRHGNFDTDGYRIYGQMFHPDGEKMGAEFLVNSFTDYDHQIPAIAPLADSGFVVCWKSWRQDGFLNGYYFLGQRFDQEGVRTGTEFLVDDPPVEWAYPHVIRNSNDGFAVGWNSYSGIYIKLYDMNGIPKGELNKLNIKSPFYFSMAPLRKDNWMLYWCDQENLYGQILDSKWKIKDACFRINSREKICTGFPEMKTLSDSGFVVAWTGSDNILSSSRTDIHIKIYPDEPIHHELIPFALDNPENDWSSSSTVVNLKWHQPSTRIVCYPWELHYKVLVDENPDFFSPMINELDQDTTLTINMLKPGTTYFWKVFAENIDGDSLWSSNTNAFFVTHDAVSGVEEEHASSLKKFTLHQNYPNPFNPVTSIRFDLPSPGFVTIFVFDVNGRRVRVLLSESRTAGSYSVKWDGRDSAGISVPSGIYICRMDVHSADGRRFSQSVKMGLVR